MLKGVFFPLIATLAIILVYPYPAAKIYEISRTNRKKLKEIQQKIDDETPITRDEARKIRKTAVQLQVDFEEQVKRKDSEIELLKSAVHQLTEESKTVIPREKDLTAKIQELETIAALQRSEITDLNHKNENYKEYIDTTLGYNHQKNYKSPEKNTAHSSEATNNSNNMNNRVSHEKLIIKIQEYLKDTKIFQHQDTKIKAINDQIILEYPYAGKIEAYKLGEMDPADFAKSFVEMADTAKSVWNNRTSQKP